MLSWSESDPDFVVEPARLTAEISDEEYEKKVTGLLCAALSSQSRFRPPKRNGSRRRM